MRNFSNLLCMCVCACVYVTVSGWRWGCGVSDDTGGVIPPTSASNLQHEKDTLVTPYLPPTIIYPHPAPSARRFSLSLLFEPKSNRVSNYERLLPQLAIKHTEYGSSYSFLVLSSMPPLARNFTQCGSNCLFSSRHFLLLCFF